MHVLLNVNEFCLYLCSMSLLLFQFTDRYFCSADVPFDPQQREWRSVSLDPPQPTDFATCKSFDPRSLAAFKTDSRPPTALSSASMHRAEHLKMARTQRALHFGSILTTRRLTQALRFLALSIESLFFCSR